MGFRQAQGEASLGPSDITVLGDSDATASPIMASRLLQLMVHLRVSDAACASIRGVLQAHGVDQQSMLGDCARIPHALLLQLMEMSAWATDSKDFSIFTLQHWKFGSHGIGDYLNANCADARGMLSTVTRYVGLLHDGINFNMRVGPMETKLVCSLLDGIDHHRWLPEYALGKVWVEMRKALGGASDVLVEVRFKHADVHDLTLYRQLFGVPVVLGHDEDALVFRTARLSSPFAASDAGLHEILDHQASQLLRRLPRRLTFRERVWEAAAAELKAGAQQAAVAKRLGMSAATLRRRLGGDGGMQYSRILDEIRCNIATRALVDRAVPIEELAAMTGFAHPPAFFRAFKRWFGCTPMEYRRACELGERLSEGRLAGHRGMRD